MNLFTKTKQKPIPSNKTATNTCMPLPKFYIFTAFSVCQNKIQCHTGNSFPARYRICLFAADNLTVLNPEAFKLCFSGGHPFFYSEAKGASILLPPALRYLSWELIVFREEIFYGVRENVALTRNCAKFHLGSIKDLFLRFAGIGGIWWYVIFFIV